MRLTIYGVSKRSGNECHFGGEVPLTNEQQKNLTMANFAFSVQNVVFVLFGMSVVISKQVANAMGSKMVNFVSIGC
jgi:hypothetical protein